MPRSGSTGLETNDADGMLCLGGTGVEGCPFGAEYTGCPRRWVVSHPSTFDDRRTDGDASRTSLIVVPCSQDFLAQPPRQIPAILGDERIRGRSFAASAPVSCWANLQLERMAVSDREVIGGNWVQTQVQSSAASPGGFVLVQQTERESPRPPVLAIAGNVPHQIGPAEDADLIQVPEAVAR